MRRNKMIPYSHLLMLHIIQAKNNITEEIVTTKSWCMRPSLGRIGILIER